MRLRFPSAKTRPDGAGVGHGGLVESADRSTEPGLWHVAETAGLVPLHGKFLVVEDQPAKQGDLLKAVQRYRPRSLERLRLNAVDLQFDRLDFLSGRRWNPNPIDWAVSGTKH